MKNRRCTKLRFLLTLSLLVSPACQGSKKRIVKSTEGFDFSYGGTSEDESWAGPKVGEQVDLERVKDRRGVSLSRLAEKELFVIVLIDPQCPAGAASSDQLQGVRDRIAQHGVPYYLVSVTSSVPAHEFFAYADSLNLATSAFLWGTDEPQPPSTLYSMVLPSHLLLTKDGRILRKWPGTSPSELNRARMVNQIVSDTLHELQRPKS